MAKLYLNGKICFRRDTKENWQLNNPILEAGEIGIVTDGISSQRIKIGDGTNYWNDLEWVQTADLVYDGDSENAQSGVALKSIFADKQDKFATVNIGTDCELSNLKPISFTSTVKVLTPAASSNPATKKYVDDKSALKVDKVTGKGLSTNDYDAAEKAKVASAVQPADLAGVATSGSYADLTDTPTIDQTFDRDSENAQSGKAVDEAVTQAGDAKMDKFGTVINFGADITRVSGNRPRLQFISYDDLSYISKHAYFMESEEVSFFVGTYAYPITMVNILPESVEISGYNSDGNRIYYAKTDSTGINFADTPLKSTALPETFYDLTNKDYVDDKSALKVDKVAGKGLSTNDYDAAEKAKVASAVQPADLAGVATSGSYADLTDTPTIDQTFDRDSENAQSGVAVAQAILNEANKGNYELIESITVTEEAVISRQYTNHYKKLVVMAIDNTNKLPTFRLMSGIYFWEFYTYTSYQQKQINLIGEIIVPNVFSNVYTLYGSTGGSASIGFPIVDRFRNAVSYFDGFKSDGTCKIGTTIKVYGVKV